MFTIQCRVGADPWRDVASAAYYQDRAIAIEDASERAACSAHTSFPYRFTDFRVIDSSGAIVWTDDGLRPKRQPPPSTPREALMAKIKITLSERRPVEIDTDAWTLIAEASTFSGEPRCQANAVAYIKVRQHEDGRRIVYGAHERGPGGMPAGWREARGGFLVEASEGDWHTPNEAETVRAIRRVAGIVDDDELGAACVADLPPEELS